MRGQPVIILHKILVVFWAFSPNKSSRLTCDGFFCRFQYQFVQTGDHFSLRLWPWAHITWLCFVYIQDVLEMLFVYVFKINVSECESLRAANTAADYSHRKVFRCPARGRQFLCLFVCFVCLCVCGLFFCYPFFFKKTLFFGLCFSVRTTMTAPMNSYSIKATVLPSPASSHYI